MGIYVSLHISGCGYFDGMPIFRLLKRVLSENLGEGWGMEITLETHIKTIKISISFAFVITLLGISSSKLIPNKEKNFMQETFTPLFIVVNSRLKNSNILQGSRLSLGECKKRKFSYKVRENS